MTRAPTSCFQHPGSLGLRLHAVRDRSAAPRRTPVAAAASGRPPGHTRRWRGGAEQELEPALAQADRALEALVDGICDERHQHVEGGLGLAVAQALDERAEPVNAT